MDSTKTTAKNNRTLTVTEEEAAELSALVTKASDLSGGMDAVDRLVCGDVLDVLSHIPDESVDLIIIDPPYNLPRNFNGLKFAIMPTEEYEAYLRSWFPKVCRKLKPNGSLYMCGDWKCTSAMQRVMEDELTVLNRITWQREKGRGTKHNWKNGMEDIWFGVKNPKDYTFNVDAVMLKRRVRAPYRVDGKPKDWEENSNGKYRLTHPSNFWDDISIPFWSMPENTKHPTQKPEKLYAKLILASSNEGDVVLDPFMGSGTACVVAKKLGRRYIGIEINSEYCLWAAKRLQMAEADNAIQGYSGGVFWERNTMLDQLKEKPHPASPKGRGL